MNAFTYQDSRLHCERLPLAKLAKQLGTPLYVYSGSAIKERFLIFDKAFAGSPHTVCYSVKANSNLSILKMLAAMGSGFDVVSGGELVRVVKANRRAAKKVVFSGVGKTAAEMDTALDAGIMLFNVESEGELRVLASRAAKLRKRAPVALRVNPDVNANTHPYISTGLREHKFGISINDALRVYRAAAQSKWLDVAGVSVHIGSQITTVDPFSEALARVAGLVKALEGDGHHIRYVDAGGGLGINYKADAKRAGDHFPAVATAYAEALRAALKGLDIHLLLEPGRAIVGPAGLLLTRVLYVKQNGKKRFVVVDAGMNDLIRPSLYSAHHEVVPVDFEPNDRPEGIFDVVGPVCESGDFFARDRALPQFKEGDLVALLDAGAYGIALASNYNTRPNPAEVMVEGRRARVIRKRQRIEDLLKPEL